MPSVSACNAARTRWSSSTRSSAGRPLLGRAERDAHRLIPIQEADVRRAVGRHREGGAQPPLPVAQAERRTAVARHAQHGPWPGLAVSQRQADAAVAPDPEDGAHRSGRIVQHDLLALKASVSGECAPAHGPRPGDPERQDERRPGHAGGPAEPRRPPLQRREAEAELLDVR